MASNGITRAVLPAILILLQIILLSSGAAEADDNQCGVLISDAPMCYAANADACETWCYHKGYSTGACYAAVNRKACICENLCPQAGRRLPSSVEPTRA